MPETADKKAKTTIDFNAEKLQSEVIDFLRFPIIIGVLLAHNFGSTVHIASGQLGNDAWPPLLTLCNDFFSLTVGRLPPPLFFFISGFLFFLHCEKFTAETWLKKLKSRARTLLVPYLFWNILTVAVMYIAWHIPTFSLFFSESHDITWQYPLRALWALPNEQEIPRYPIAYQFWFIRDLMVMIVLSPILYYLVKKFRFYGVALLGLLWFYEWWQAWLPWLAGHGMSSDALFFFTVGAWFALNKRNIVEDAERVANIIFILYPLLALADVCTKLHIPGVQHVYLPFVHHSGILLGIAASFALTAYLLRTGKARLNPFLSSASFFVLAAHEPLFLSKLRKIVFVIFQPQSDLALTINYFLLVIVVVAVLLGLYWLLRRVLPGFTRVITGGR